MEQNIACPRDDCGSSDAYTEYDDGHGWCFSCERGYFPKPLRPEDFEQVHVDGFRGIGKKACEMARIWSYVDEAGNVVFREYEYGDDGSIMRRVHDKKMWTKGRPSALGGMELWNAGSSHYVTVVEGGEDGGAAIQMLNVGKTVHPVVWLKSGNIAAKDRDAIYQYLKQFETVKLAIENDEKGKKAKQLLCQMLPNKIKEVSLTKHKDANDYLMAGDVAEFKQAWTNAKVYTPDNIYHTEEDVMEVLSNPELEAYYKTSYPDLNAVVRGIPMNHVTLITGNEGLGKTEILRALEIDALNEGYTIGVLHLEETKLTLYKGLACYALNKNARDPDNPVDTKEIFDGVREVTGNFENLFVFEFKQNPDINMIMEQINYLVYVCGCKYIFIDPINQFDPVDDTSRVEFLDSLSKRVEKYVSNHPCGVVWTAHVNDDGYTRNSRMISKACSVRIDIKRDLLAEDPVRRNLTQLYVSKNRPFAKTGPAGTLFFDETTFTMQPGFEVRDAPEDDGLENTKQLLPF